MKPWDQDPYLFPKKEKKPDDKEQDPVITAEEQKLDDLIKRLQSLEEELDQKALSILNRRMEYIIMLLDQQKHDGSLTESNYHTCENKLQNLSLSIEEARKDPTLATLIQNIKMIKSELLLISQRLAALKGKVQPINE